MKVETKKEIIRACQSRWDFLQYHRTSYECFLLRSREQRAYVNDVGYGAIFCCVFFQTEYTRTSSRFGLRITDYHGLDRR